MAIPRNTVLLATKYTRYSLFLKYETFKHELLCNSRSLFLWVSSGSLLVATFGSKEHDKMQVKNTIAAMNMKVILHEVLFKRA